MSATPLGDRKNISEIQVLVSTTTHTGFALSETSRSGIDISPIFCDISPLNFRIGTLLNPRTQPNTSTPTRIYDKLEVSGDNIA
jgi:hypothetical protein